MNRGKIMTLNRQIVFIGCLILWTLYGFLYPTWVGTMYMRDSDGSNNRRFISVTGLPGGNTTHQMSPLWSSPKLNENAPRGLIRWPLQKPYSSNHVELDLTSIFVRWSLGVIVWGLACRLFAWLRPSDTFDPVLALAWPISICVAMAYVCLYTLAVMTMGYALIGPIINGFILVGLLSGLSYGAVAVVRNRSPKKPQVDGSKLADNPDIQIQKSRGQWYQPGTDPIWFMFGFGAGFGVSKIAASIASRYRGPVIGISELGTPRHLYSQGAVNTMTGLGIMIVGWSTGLLMTRHPVPRVFAWGLIVSSTVFGLLYAGWR